MKRRPFLKIVTVSITALFSFPLLVQGDGKTPSEPDRDRLFRVPGPGQTPGLLVLNK